MTTETPQNTELPGVCIRCFGRAFARIGTGISNIERGETFYQENEKTFLNGGFTLSSEEGCSMCHGIFLRLPDYFEAFMEESGGIEFSTFLVGSSFPGETVQMEARLQEVLGDNGEPIKREFNREFGKFIADKTGKKTDFNEPDLNLVVDLRYDSFTIKSRSLYVYGVYRKYRRDIPQTRWIHKKDVDISIEDIVGEKLKAMSGGENYFLHGAGREDVDVRMLGNGREFIIEATAPRVRSISLADLKNTVNSSGKGVEIDSLRFASKSNVVSLKGMAYDKSYRVRVVADSAIDPGKMSEAVLGLTGKHIYQRTPLRVSTRRSDLVRDRQIRELSVEEIHDNSAVLIVRAEAGTYIKELIHGDGGRTTPSLSEMYGEELKVDCLDVIWIHRSSE